MSAKMLSFLQNISPQSRSPNHHVNTSWHRNCHRTSASHRRIHLRPLCCCKLPKMPTALTTSLTQYFRPTSTASTKPIAAPPSSPSSHPTAATQTSHAARRLTTLFLRKKAVFQCMRRFRVMVMCVGFPPPLLDIL